MPEDLIRHACIRDTNMRGDGAWTLFDEDREHRLRVSGRFLVNSARAARDMAMQNEGIAFCPDYVVKDGLAARQLVRVLPRAHGPRLDVHAVYLPQRRLPRRTRVLLEFLVQFLGEGNRAGAGD